jgi:hypothetical protein
VPLAFSTTELARTSRATVSVDAIGQVRLIASVATESTRSLGSAETPIAPPPTR